MGVRVEVGVDVITEPVGVAGGDVGVGVDVTGGVGA
jgi:hypothetical protein